MKRSAAGLFLLPFLLFASCSQDAVKPEKDSEAYRKVVSDYYISLAAMQADRALFAIEKMKAVADRYPREASAHANLAVFAMRQGDYELAGERIRKAMDQRPERADFRFLAGLIERRNGNVDRAVEHLRKATQLDSTDVKIRYALAEELQRQDDRDNAKEILNLLQSISGEQPGNLAVLLEIVRTGVKWNKEEALQEALQRLEEKTQSWPEESRQQFHEIKNTILSGSSDNLSFQLAFLENGLNDLPEYQSDVQSVKFAPNQVGFLVRDFAWLPQPSTSAAKADNELQIEFSSTHTAEEAEMVAPVALADSTQVDLVRVSGGVATINGIQFPFPGRGQSSKSVVTLDYDYDFIPDLLFAGSSGIRLYRQKEDSTLVDRTSSLNLSPEVKNDNYWGAWARDVDTDGDLDIILSLKEAGARVLRNNGDATFSKVQVFDSVNSPASFKWADLDGDADPDAAFIDRQGRVSLLLNDRSGVFRKVDNLPVEKRAHDIEISDIDNDAQFELLVWSPSGIMKINYSASEDSWKSRELVSAPNTADKPENGSGRLYSLDLDNNGANDILASHSSRSYLWLNSNTLKMDSTAHELPSNIVAYADLNGDMRLDLLRLNKNGGIEEGINSGSQNYGARIIRPRASGKVGDRRINSFGIGGAIEIRSGLLYQKQPINHPWVHLGLGEYQEAELLRIIWPNGTSQSEFAELGYGSKIFNEQILKGSCPWLFAYNGEEMEFVTDFIWRSPLGLRINAQTTAGVVQTEDRVKIRGDQLVEKDGYYELRITADLWETHFFDHISLMAVDHPVDTEIFIDERFSIPPPDLGVRLTSDLHPVKSVTDENNTDRTDAIRELDNNFLHQFKLTKYQGVAEEHFIEVEIGDEAPKNGPLWLLAHGWVRPTDSSINFALSQGSHKAPRGLSMEVPDGNGNWTEVRSNMGFPAGKAKTVMINLEDIFPDDNDRRLRLHTTTETYWDAIWWTEGRPDAPVKREVLSPETMELRYRGFSEVIQENAHAPELPDYQTIAGTTQKWFDLQGFYTRFGDVSELLTVVDDRYVIMNAGDELVLRFKAPEKLKKGWKRDFVLIGDGWVKDGDFNTRFSKTVRPLPSHSINQYQNDTAPNRLEEDPVFQKHREDWVKYHNRYITPRQFQTALKLNKNR